MKISKNSAPKISVIIPLFNKEPHIARALNSVLNQTFQDFEIIVVDDGSTDNGANIVREFTDMRIRFIQQENQGASSARNHGTDCAKGELIAFLDADDEWTSLHLELLTTQLELFPEAGAYSTSYTFCRKDGSIFHPNYKAMPPFPFEGLLPNYFKSASLGDPPICTSVVGIPKKIFREMGGFLPSEWMGEDHDLWGKIALVYPIAFSSEVGCIYHTDAVNRACDKKLPTTEEAVVRMGKDAINKGIVPSKILKDFREYIAYKEILRARNNIFANNFAEARKILLDTKTQHHNYEKIFWLLISFFPKSLFHGLLSMKRRVFI
jgi:glycosyltransferase involved in cell wall biosynthesis